MKSIIVRIKSVGSPNKGITSMVINGSGHLIVTYSDTTTQDLGKIEGSDGKGIASIEIQVNGHLIITYSDATTEDIGLIPGFHIQNTDTKLDEGRPDEVSATEIRSHIDNVNNPHQTTASQVGAIPAAEKGAAGGVAPLDGTGKVPALYLPSYVDDVLEVANVAALPAVGESEKLYVTLDTSLIYRWSGTVYVEVSPGGAIGGGGTALRIPMFTGPSIIGNSVLEQTSDGLGVKVNGAGGIELVPVGGGGYGHMLIAPYSSGSSRHYLSNGVGFFGFGGNIGDRNWGFFDGANNTCVVINSSGIPRANFDVVGKVILGSGGVHPNQVGYMARIAAGNFTGLDLQMFAVDDGSGNSPFAFRYDAALARYILDYGQPGAAGSRLRFGAGANQYVQMDFGYDGRLIYRILDNAGNEVFKIHTNDGDTFLSQLAGSFSYIGVPNAAPTDARIQNSNLVPYLDEIGGKLKFRIRKSDGTLMTLEASGSVNPTQNYVPYRDALGAFSDSFLKLSGNSMMVECHDDFIIQWYQAGNGSLRIKPYQPGHTFHEIYSGAGEDIVVQPGAGAYVTLKDRIKILDGSQGAGKVLTSDANGVATWQTPGASTVKKYKALLTQTGTNAPVVTVLNSGDSDFLGNIVWTYSAVGIYTGQLNNAFTANKTFMLTGQDDSLYKFGLFRNGISFIQFLTQIMSDSGTSRADGVANSVAISIEVYP